MAILSDKIIFPLVQVLFFVFVAYAYYRAQLMKKDSASLTRSEKSWNYFYFSYGITSILLIQVINGADVTEGYRTILSVIDLGLLLYLTFFNGWYRNLIAKFVVRSQKMEE